MMNSIVHWHRLGLAYQEPKQLLVRLQLLPPEQHPAFWLAINLALAVTYALMIIDWIARRRQDPLKYTK